MSGHAKVIREFAPWWRRGFVLAIGDNESRYRASGGFERLHCPPVIHKSAIVSRNAIIGRGTVIMAGAIVGPNTVIGDFCIVNHGASVDHDCVLGDYVHIAPGAHLCGGVRIEIGALVGVGVGIAPSAQIPAWSLVKARRLEIESIQNHG